MVSGEPWGDLCLPDEQREHSDRRGVMAIFAGVTSDRLPAPGLEPSILPQEGQSKFVAEVAWGRRLREYGRAGPRVVVASGSARVTTLAGHVSPSRELETHEAMMAAVPLFFCQKFKDRGSVLP